MKKTRSEPQSMVQNVKKSKNIEWDYEYVFF